MGLGFSVIAGLLTAVGYAAFALVLPLRGKRSWPNYLFALAAAATALWALSVALADYEWLDAWVPRAAGALRDACWFAIIVSLLRQDTHAQPLWRRLALSAGVLIVAEVIFAALNLNVDSGLGVTLNQPTIQFAVSVMGLILTENLVRNVGPARMWSVKQLAIGLTALFAYNIVLRIPEFLGGHAIQIFDQAQPLVYLVALPLFVVTAVRNDSLRLHVHSSRNVVFHTATLIFAGILLLGTAAAAAYVRRFGGTPAAVLSIVLGFAGLVGMTVAVSARSIRSQIKTFINENFFSYKYDYRLEWTKFIQALARHEERGGPERVLLTLADLLDSPGGVLFVRRSGWKQFVRLAHSTFGDNFGPIQQDDPLLASFEDEHVAFLELTSREQETALWRARFPKAWLAVPLRFREELVGFALLHKPRAPKRLDWEDRSLVALIAMQLAAHLVHEHTAQALADSQQLAEFNNRVTFALHDLKNTAGQLGLLLHNAERFGDDAEFRADMLQTIRHAVDNLQGLITKLRDGTQKGDGAALVRLDVREVVSQYTRRKAKSGIVVGEAGGEPVYAEVTQPAAFENALEHVVSNAVEASPAPNSVRISVERDSDRVRVSVRDNGHGMAPEFVAHELFRPLHTTKKKGLGIGAYQAREIMRKLGGDIEVQSRIGQGTTVSLLLPACREESRTTT
ncbi:MAG: PEP-CTERM system histidine kinase PrsK [Alphaproteobacteria bacterium]|nr:PEP-CTERM system histidine kinase PrsK [Alphaproteobacteria bacterium]